MGGIAFFMISTALVVLFPVVLQLRDGESRLSEVRPIHQGGKRVCVLNPMRSFRASLAFFPTVTVLS